MEDYQAFLDLNIYQQSKELFVQFITIRLSCWMKYDSSLNSIKEKA